MANQRSGLYPWAEELLSSNHINFKNPTAGQYMLLDVAPNVHNLLWYPRSNKLQVNFINGKSKMYELGEPNDATILQMFKKFLR